ncbi:MAG: hypothetical protein M3Y35_06545 [Actinomycetota bacterium]|nr:hypothetical protein [Actinomycetota bacterium]
MSYPFRRASVRLAVGLVAAALPLVGASVAQAAMAGANPLTTTSRPDLRSVTLTGTGAQYCFDKVVTSIPNPGGFYVGGYRADNFSRATGATASGNCVNATVGATTEDSFGQVAEGAVRTTGNLGNRADSTALTGSTTHNGTRGLTTAPDLTGVSVVQTGAQQIAFTYDEPVDPSAIVGTAGFHFVTSTGIDIPSDTAAISTTDPKTVIAQFPIGGGNPLVTDGVRAYSVAGAVSSANDGTLGTYDSQALPGSLGLTTGRPDLVSAVYSRQPGNNSAPGGVLGGTLGAVLGKGFGGTGINCGTTGGASCVVVDYTFNEGVNLPLATGITQTILNTINSNYYAYLSDGSFVHPAAVYEPSGTTTIGVLNKLGIGGSTTVRAIYPTANRFDEYLVKAAVTGPTQGLSTVPPVCALTGAILPVLLPPGCAAVSSTLPNGPNVTGSAPIGGNAGAFASGFSTAPDAFTATFDTLTNTASVLFDQRVFGANPANFALLDSGGNAIAGAQTVSSCPPGTAGYPCGLADGSTGPGSYVVYLGYPAPAVQVGNGRALEIKGSLGSVAGAGAFAAFAGSVFNTVAPGAAPPDSINVQQIVSPASTAAYTHLRASKVKSHKRMTWAYLHSVLVKELHKTSKHNHKTSKHNR